jgi:hypothetical protein
MRSFIHFIAVLEKTDVVFCSVVPPLGVSFARLWLIKALMPVVSAMFRANLRIERRGVGY